ncbi:microcephalin [Spea bombifrons]|uniref:microcephalin n=1 Tax=Spea bombifrons TaxID=233779 RepID=UPI00234A0472|nr:microcephalin [Spea bombifrons]
MDVSDPSSPVCGSSDILTGVTAYVEVWSSNRTENYSKTFSQQLLNLGAKVSKTFNKQVTHVVFKDGIQGTWNKAVKTGVKLVSVLWVEKCRELGSHVDESLFLPINTNNGLPDLIKKKRKCMQPKDFVEKTPENDRRLQKKFDKMCKQLDVQKASVDVPVLLFDEVGELTYSPKAVADRCSAMQKRLREMKNKRENLSPTASQVSKDFSSLKPLLGNSPSVTGDSSHDIDDDLNTSYDELWGNATKGLSPTASKAKKKSGSILNDEQILSNASRQVVNLTLQNKEEIKPEKGQMDSHTEKKGRKSLNKMKMLDGSVDSEGDVFDETHSTKQETSAVTYATLANRLIAKCKGKANKTRSLSLKSKTIPSVSSEKDISQELTKPNMNSNKSDSEESCFEDFFASNLNNHKQPLTRFSLGTLPRKSPSPPPLTSKKKRSYGEARRSTLDVFELDNCSIKKKRKIDHTDTNFIPKTLTSSNSKQVTHHLMETLDSSVKNISTPNKWRSSYLSSNETNPVINHVQETALTLSRNDALKKAPEVACVSDPGENICHAKGLEEVIPLVPCKTKLRGLEPKEERLSVTNGTVFEKHKEDVKRSNQSADCRTSASDIIDGPSAMLNEQKSEFKKTDKTKKNTRSLVMTSMSSEKQNTVIQVVKKFGGFFFTNNVCRTTTHVIAGSPRRTLNILLGIARGCWIVSYDWVLWSLEHGNWIPEEPYELSDQFPGAPICRLQRHLSAGEHQQDLLSSLPTLFISPNSQPPCDQLSEMVQLCGGKVSKTLRHAKICIGDFKGKKPPDMQNVSEKFLLDSVTQHKLQSLENYLLNR